MSEQEATIDGLKQILREVAGQADGVDLEGDILDRTFEELGYDSLALLETGSRLERAVGVKLDDSTLNEVQTPRELLAAVNENRPVRFDAA
ncbi:acyl carrier protein [Phytoactinopolyspora mesophila]|uniref:Acyl carrier protein n=1 Tax=Phytoactinopolyspora mesophila TaxID=2650750 RepID=A0A7K3M0P9_9ACTN|nr:acyl carrier protein [Phytoactinopolyspora mesophila]NDL56873.1 acyl carrier protein [Phytoactinopolyspora mesophila]